MPTPMPGVSTEPPSVGAMRPGVTAILVAQNGARHLDRTIAALKAQTRAPERTVFVHIASTDETVERMRAAAPDILITVDATASFGRALAEATAVLDERDGASADGWLWFLSADNAPDH